MNPIELVSKVNILGIDEKEFTTYHTDREFALKANEVLKDESNITSILITISTAKEYKSIWSRSEAIILGLILRINKIQTAIIEQVKSECMEITYILFRCLAESIVNLLYILRRNDELVFDEYIEYSLRTEKRFRNKIAEDSQNREKTQRELRLLESLDRALITSGFTLDKVNEKNSRTWSENLFDKCKTLGLEDDYIAFFSLPSHFIHGNWQNLLSHHLDYDCKGNFYPDPRLGLIKPQPVLAATSLSLSLNDLYAQYISKDKKLISSLNSLHEKVKFKIDLIYKKHQQFLENKPMHS